MFTPLFGVRFLRRLSVCVLHAASWCAFSTPPLGVRSRRRPKACVIHAASWRALSMLPFGVRFLQVPSPGTGSLRRLQACVLYTASRRAFSTPRTGVRSLRRPKACVRRPKARVLCAVGARPASKPEWYRQTLVLKPEWCRRKRWVMRQTLGYGSIRSSTLLCTYACVDSTF